ncbi:hypothetical protein [Pseudonocardia sp. H11422]|uniref:hypothetical protein n=1 Tax=Pseudonocardia sp. H11422 TaxID=2835866 RepID=UPI001BDD98A9|nr:hypothetical protein [Pseudonocardia sp. H11422]
MSDAEQPEEIPTVRTRLEAMLSEERIASHLERRVIKLDGVVVEDLDTPASPGTRIVIGGS